MVPPEQPNGLDTKRWFAVHTLARQEMKASVHLQAQNYEIFCPTIFKTVRHARKLRMVKAPLFPRYIFVRLDLKCDRWSSINGTFGVSRLVMANDRPAPVPKGLVEALITATDSQNVIRLDQDLDIGDKISILAGPFAGFVGELARFNGSKRVQVLLEAMGGQISIAIDSANLRKAS